MTLNVNLMLCRQCYAYSDETAEAIITRFFLYKVELYLSYLHVGFDVEIKENPFEFQNEFWINLRPKLNWRLC